MKHHITEKDALAAERWRREGGGVGADGAPLAQPSAYLDRLAAQLRKQPPPMASAQARTPDGQKGLAKLVLDKDQAIPLRLISDAEMHERAQRIEDALKKLNYAADAKDAAVPK